MAQMGHVGKVRQRVWLASGLQLFLLFGISVNASGQTAPSREYIRLGATIIAIENPPLPAVATPTFSPVPGSYTSATTVALRSTTAGATIRYTIDNTTPTETHGTVGTSVTLRSSVTLQAIAYKTGMADSGVASGIYTLSGEVVSTPSRPSGPTAVATGLTGTFSASGSSSSFGNPVQYIFYWGDGTNSGWLATGATSASHSWSSNGTYSVTVQARSAPNPSVVSAVSTALSVTIGPRQATLSFSANSYSIGGQWTFWITSNLPNQTFNYCGIHNGGSPGCYTPWGTTDGNGNYSTSNTFDATTPGSWQQYAVFSALSYQTNTVSFSVQYPSISLSISATSWAVGGNWTLYVSSNLLNQSLDLCGSHNGGSPGCIGGYISTDSGGNWSTPGTFGSGDVGSWQEWANFIGYSSNQISFTVSP